MDDGELRHEPGKRFSCEIDGQRSLLEYTVADGRMTILHTEVPAALRGRGLAGRLVRAAFDHARAQGFTVYPRCAYAAEWVERHPEVADLLARR